VHEEPVRHKDDDRKDAKLANGPAADKYGQTAEDRVVGDGLESVGGACFADTKRNAFLHWKCDRGLAYRVDLGNISGMKIHMN